MCLFYGISRSGYYAWKTRKDAPSKDIELVELIEECQRKHKRRYGYRRVALWLKNEKGMMVNHKKVLRITGKYNLLSVIRRRRLHRYVPNGNLVYENILNSNFRAQKAYHQLTGDLLCTFRAIYPARIAA
jgi:hypothetical protein